MADHRNAFLTDEVILTAGGSSYYDIVGRRLKQIELQHKPTVRILRSGCYVTHDCGTYVEHLEQMRQRDPVVVAAVEQYQQAHGARVRPGSDTGQTGV